MTTAARQSLVSFSFPPLFGFCAYSVRTLYISVWGGGEASDFVLYLFGYDLVDLCAFSEIVYDRLFTLGLRVVIVTYTYLFYLSVHYSCLILLDLYA